MCAALLFNSAGAPHCRARHQLLSFSRQTCQRRREGEGGEAASLRLFLAFRRACWLDGARRNTIQCLACEHNRVYTYT